MIDFSKRLAAKRQARIIDPVELYDTLDRASDKGPLRPAQMTVLQNWHAAHRLSKEVIVKLHTGQGKTLIGLLMLQSRLNERTGPAIYLCPNRFLISQTCYQAQQFGITVCTAPNDLPPEFLDGESILVTSVQKLFNGLTKFRTGPNSLKVGTVLMDDSHACVDAIRDAFTVRLPSDKEAYRRLRDLFADSLNAQGTGSYADICSGTYDALLPVPYWDWRQREDEVVRILASQSESDSVKFAWPLLRDIFADCLCAFSGTSAEISPYIPPIGAFGSYSRATHRIFMSATVTNDAFLVKGLQLLPETIQKPLVYEKERWSGEKMIIIPELVDNRLTRTDVIAEYAPPRHGRLHGVVAVTPSGAASAAWEKAGARVVTSEDIEQRVENLKAKKFDSTLVFSNRYDGIDLPDDMCRILILDSKPHTDNLADRLSDRCRPGSEIMALRIARTIEQGIGRSVRGEKDYCVVILTGHDLVESVRSKVSRAYLSSQTQLQIEMGLEIVGFAKDEMKRGNLPMEVIRGLVNQCLKRDPGWKQFYAERMNSIELAPPSSAILQLFETELKAEKAFQAGDWKKAAELIHSLIDGQEVPPEERGWYLQEMARYTEPYDRAESNKLQLRAHRMNRLLLKPQSGMRVSKLTISTERISNIIRWVSSFDNYDVLHVHLCEITEKLAFGVSAEKFEGALNKLGVALGFVCERPDKEWKEGPDNLWALEENSYLLIECKNEVALGRGEIHKSETGQMNNAIAWFSRNYPGARSLNTMVIPANLMGRGAGFNEDVKVMRPKELGALMKAVKNFFREFQTFDFKSLSPSAIQGLLDTHKLDVASLTTLYFKATEDRV